MAEVNSTYGSCIPADFWISWLGEVWAHEPDAPSSGFDWSNIAEGYGRSTRGEYLLFLGHARGSCSEVETQIVIAKELRFGSEEQIGKAEEFCGEAGRMLGGVIKSLRAKS